MLNVDLVKEFIFDSIILRVIGVFCKYFLQKVAS